MFDRLRSAARRPARSGAVFLSYIGIIGALAVGVNADYQGDRQLQRETVDRATALARESEQRTRDICFVIIRSHEAAKADKERLARAVKTTREYLADPRSNDSPALYERIRDQFPQTINAAKSAAKRERGLRAPPTCQPYLKEK